MSIQNSLNEFEFWANVLRKSDANVCWNWILSTDSSGYGIWRVKRKLYKAHRLAYELYYKVSLASDTRLVLHKCLNNRRCCNPNHLYLGDGLQNAEDRRLAGNTIMPDDIIFTEEEVIYYRNLYKTGFYKISDLVELKKCKYMIMYQMINRKSWKHLP